MHLAKTPMGKAITYSLNQWKALIRYVDDPILNIDNNISERTLRMVVIGRKNYMFAGSEAGAKRAAIIYCLIASCKLMGHDPFAYFNDVLRKVSTHPAEKIDKLYTDRPTLGPYGMRDALAQEYDIVANHSVFSV